MRRHPPWLVLVLVGAVVGVVFAAVSTYDFVQHLDRQVHSLHCSFIPGVTHAGESGCQVAMMSPYSSVFRATVWGGVPISLPAMSVFAFLVFYTLDLAVTRRRDDPRATGFLALAAVLPAATSAVMLAVSLTKLDAVCKLCACIYVASAVCLVGAVLAWRSAARVRGERGPAPRPDRADRYHREPAFVGRASTSSSAHLVAVGVDTAPASGGFLAAMFGLGVAFVVAPVALYLAMAPDHARFIGSCEGLSHPDDNYSVMVRVDRSTSHGAPAPAPAPALAVEVLDPLCPACKAFEQRLAASGLADRLDRKAVLFPLDNTCNWMVTEATHPGACTVSEAVLCAGDKAPDVIAWAFEEQDRVRAAAKTDPAAAARIVKERFPELAACVGSPDARSRLNKSMRWIVANNIRVLTPQLFIDRVKLCDEDVDLGLEYTLSSMLERHARGALAPVPLEKSDSPATTRAGDTGAKATPDRAASGLPSEAAAAAQPADKVTSDKGNANKVGADSPTDDKASADKASSDKASSNKAGSENAGTDKGGTEGGTDNASPATDKGGTDKDGADKSGTDKGAEKASSDKGAEKASSDKGGTDNANSDKGAEKASSGKGGTDSASSDKGAEKASSGKSGTDSANSDKASTGKGGASKATSEKTSGDAAAGKGSSSPTPRKPTPRKPAPRKTAPVRPDDGSPKDQPVTRPGDVP